MDVASPFLQAACRCVDPALRRIIENNEEQEVSISHYNYDAYKYGRKHRGRNHHL
jgi:hypothetical protein